VVAAPQPGGERKERPAAGDVECDEVDQAVGGIGAWRDPQPWPEEGEVGREELADLNHLELTVDLEADDERLEAGHGADAGPAGRAVIGRVGAGVGGARGGVET